MTYGVSTPVRVEFRGLGLGLSGGDPSLANRVVHLNPTLNLNAVMPYSLNPRKFQLTAQTNPAQDEQLPRTLGQTPNIVK